MGKLTEAQRNALKVLWSLPGSTHSTDLKMATMQSLARKGYLSRHTVGLVSGPHTIFEITDSGRAALEGET